MRRLTLAVALQMLASPALALPPGSFMGDVPTMPLDACHATTAQKDDFGQRVAALKRRVDQELTRRRAESRSAHQAAAPQVQQKLRQEAGLTPQELAKLQHGSAAERAAASDKLQEERYGLSAEDLRDVKKMSPEARRKWAAAYAKEQQASASDPAVRKRVAEAGARGPQPALDPDFRAMQRRLAAQENGFVQQLRQLGEDAKGKEVREQARSERRTDAAKGLEEQYCLLLGPRQVEVLGNYRDWLAGSLADFARVEKVQGDMLKAQTGQDPAEPGELGILKIKSFLDSLEQLYQYDVRRAVW